MKKSCLQKFDFIVLSSRGTWAQIWQLPFLKYDAISEHTY